MKTGIRIEHIGLAARDPERLKDWYEAHLGAKVLWTDGKGPPAFLLAFAGHWLEIYPAAAGADSIPENTMAGWRHLALRVENIERARDELAESGVELVGEVRPAGGAGRVQFFRDAEGNLLHLVERPSGFLGMK